MNTFGKVMKDPLMTTMGAQHIMTSVNYFWLQTKSYFEIIIWVQNMISSKSENIFEKNYDFDFLKSYFWKYFWLQMKSYFEIILFFENMTSIFWNHIIISKYDFDFGQIIKIKYFLTSPKSENKIKLFYDFDFLPTYFTLWFRKKTIMVPNNKITCSIEKCYNMLQLNML